MESYREMFERCTEEREKKFEQLRSKVKKSKAEIAKGASCSVSSRRRAVTMISSITVSAPLLAASSACTGIVTKLVTANANVAPTKRIFIVSLLVNGS